MPVVYGVNPTKPRKPCKKNGTRKAVKMAEENPRKGKKRGRKKGSSKKSGGAKTRYRTKTVTKWRTRNPATKSSRGYRAKSSAKRGFAALDIGNAFRGSIALVGGMVIAKVAVNKITSNGSETERWSWPNIATAALAGFLGAFILGAVFRLPQHTTRYIFMGGLALAAYKAFTCKIAPQWAWTTSWFGADEDVNPALLGMGAEGEIDIFAPVPVSGYGAETYEVVDGYGEESGEIGQDTNQMLTAMGYAGSLSPYNPAMGGTLSPVSPEMGFGAISAYPSDVTQRAANLVRSSKAYPGSY